VDFRRNYIALQTKLEITNLEQERLTKRLSGQRSLDLYVMFICEKLKNLEGWRQSKCWIRTWFRQQGYEGRFR